MYLKHCPLEGGNGVFSQNCKNPEHVKMQLQNIELIKLHLF